MAQITAAMVKQLREMTDSPMMECKKALVEADGDMDAAVDVLSFPRIPRLALCLSSPARPTSLVRTLSSPALLPTLPRSSPRLSLPISMLCSLLP